MSHNYNGQPSPFKKHNKPGNSQQPFNTRQTSPENQNPMFTYQDFPPIGAALPALGTSTNIQAPKVVAVGNETTGNSAGAINRWNSSVSVMDKEFSRMSTFSNGNGNTRHNGNSFNGMGSHSNFNNGKVHQSNNNRFYDKQIVLNTHVMSNNNDYGSSSQYQPNGFNNSSAAPFIENPYQLNSMFGPQTVQPGAGQIPERPYRAHGDADSVFGIPALLPVREYHGDGIPHNGIGVLTWLSGKAGLITPDDQEDNPIPFQLKDFCDASIGDLSSVLRVGFHLRYSAHINERNEIIPYLISPAHGPDADARFADNVELFLEPINPNAPNAKESYENEMELPSIELILAAFKRHNATKLQLGNLHTTLTLTMDDPAIARYVGTSSMKRRQFVERRTHIFRISNDDAIHLQHPVIYETTVHLSKYLLSHGGVTSIEALYDFFVGPGFPQETRSKMGCSRGGFLDLLLSQTFSFAVFPTRIYVAVRRNLPTYDYSTFINSFCTTAEHATRAKPVPFTTESDHERLGVIPQNRMRNYDREEYMQYQHVSRQHHQQANSHYQYQQQQQYYQQYQYQQQQYTGNMHQYQMNHYPMVNQVQRQIDYLPNHMEVAGAQLPMQQTEFVEPHVGYHDLPSLTVENAVGSNDLGHQRSNVIVPPKKMTDVGVQSDEVVSDKVESNMLAVGQGPQCTCKCTCGQGKSSTAIGISRIWSNEESSSSDENRMFGAFSPINLFGNIGESSISSSFIPTITPDDNPIGSGLTSESFYDLFGTTDFFSKRANFDKAPDNKEK